MEILGRIKDWLAPVPPVMPPGALMVTSWEGVAEIAGHEGIVPGVYVDSAGVLTWGVGHTAAAGDPDPSTMPRGMPKNVEATVDEALRVFKRDLEKYEGRVREAVRAPLRQHEFDALVSFDFNTGGIYRARLTEALNAGEEDAARHFMGWLRPPEIRGRREQEMTLFQTGRYNPKPTPIWRVNAAGKITGLIGQMSDDELKRRMA